MEPAFLQSGAKWKLVVCAGFAAQQATQSIQTDNQVRPPGYLRENCCQLTARVLRTGIPAIQPQKTLATQERYVALGGTPSQFPHQRGLANATKPRDKYVMVLATI